MPALILSNASPRYDEAMTAAKAFATAATTAGKSTRKMAGAILLASCADEYALEPLLEDAKRAMGYAKLDKRDQACIRKVAQDIRTVAGAWPTLPDSVKAEAISGKLLFPALLSDVKRRNAEEEKRASELAVQEEAEAEAKRLAEAGFNTPEEEAKVQAEADALVERDRFAALASNWFIGTMATDERTDGENAALAAMFDAIDAYRLATVQMQEEA